MIFVLSDIRMVFVFQFGLLFQILNIVIGIASYYFVFKYFLFNEVVTEYNQTPLSFIILGMATNSLLITAMHSFYAAVNNVYYKRILEKVLTTTTSPYTLFIGSVISSFLPSIVTTITYLVTGAVFFGARYGNLSNAGIALAVLVVGVMCTLGVGVFLAGLFCISPLFRQSSNFIMTLINLFTTTFTGAMFPVRILPWWIRAISYLFPQTYTIELVRLALAYGSSSLPLDKIGGLLISGTVFMLVGVFILKKGLYRIRKEGFVLPEKGITLILS